MFTEAVVVVCLVLSVSGSPISERIVNGTDAREGEIPYIVSLRLQDRHTCGGSILDSRHILTAAHCVQYDVIYYSVQYGVTRISSALNAPNVIEVSKITVHEGYVPGNGYLNDVAVVELKSDIPFGVHVQPVKLPSLAAATPENAPATLSGWGYPYTGGAVMEDLQTVDIVVFSDADCERIHAGTGPTYSNYHVCAGIPEGGKGQCSGDSGGPLVVDGVQVGIVSWSVKPCTVQGFPGVFTKVSTQLGWIQRQVAA